MLHLHESHQHKKAHDADSEDNSATMKPVEDAWQLPAPIASRIMHGDPEDEYDDVDPEESMEDFMERVKENEGRQD